MFWFAKDLFDCYSYLWLFSFKDMWHLKSTSLTVYVHLLEHLLQFLFSGKLPQGPHDSAEFFLSDASIAVLVEQPERLAEFWGENIVQETNRSGTIMEIELVPFICAFDMLYFAIVSLSLMFPVWYVGVSCLAPPLFSRFVSSGLFSPGLCFVC